MQGPGRPVSHRVGTREGGAALSSLAVVKVAIGGEQVVSVKVQVGAVGPAKGGLVVGVAVGLWPGWGSAWQHKERRQLQSGRTEIGMLTCTSQIFCKCGSLTTSHHSPILVPLQ